MIRRPIAVLAVLVALSVSVPVAASAAPAGLEHVTMPCSVCW